MEHLDLFSGIGGFSLGLEAAGFVTSAFCEIDPFCQEILNKHWPDVPIYNDVRDVRKDVLGFRPTIITAGFPCQPFSLNGKRNKDDERNLWKETYSVIADVRPRWVILENVYGAVSAILDDILLDLAAKGYAAWPFVLPASAYGADHKRDRLYVVAELSPVTYAEGFGVEGMWSERVKESYPLARPFLPIRAHNGEWQVEPDICRAPDGFPRKIHYARLKALGNAVCPPVVEVIGRAIMRTIEAQK